MPLSKRDLFVLTVGIVLGATIATLATVRYMRIEQRQSKDVFAHKGRCLQIAHDYERENTNIPYAAVSVLQVEYSSDRNSCIAKLLRNGITDASMRYSVVDLLSGSEIVSGVCNSQKNECNATFFEEMSKKQDSQFRDLMNAGRALR